MEDCYKDWLFGTSPTGTLYLNKQAQINPIIAPIGWTIMVIDQKDLKDTKRHVQHGAILVKKKT